MMQLTVKWLWNDARFIVHFDEQIFNPLTGELLMISFYITEGRSVEKAQFDGRLNSDMYYRKRVNVIISTWSDVRLKWPSLHAIDTSHLINYFLLFTEDDKFKSCHLRLSIANFPIHLTTGQ